MKERKDPIVGNDPRTWGPGVEHIPFITGNHPGTYGPPRTSYGLPSYWAKPASKTIWPAEKPLAKRVREPIDGGHPVTY